MTGGWGQAPQTGGYGGASGYDGAPATGYATGGGYGTGGQGKIYLKFQNNLSGAQNRGNISSDNQYANPILPKLYNFVY